ncbi:MAG: aspartate/glutamate racemase family protein [Acetobacteraceae bacterium]
MRILLINPNTTEAVTQRIADAARGVAAPDTEIVPATAQFGAAIIGSRVEAAVSAAAVVERLAACADGCDAVIIGASVDSGLAAAREMLDIPVVAITEAALHTACLLGGRIGAITMGAGNDTFIREQACAYGLGTRVGAVHTLPMTPLEFLADIAAGARAIGAVAETMVAQQGVDTIVLIGAVMAGIPPLVQPMLRVPVLEGVTAAVGLAEALVRLRVPPARAGSYAAPPAARVAALVGSLVRRSG